MKVVIRSVIQLNKKIEQLFEEELETIRKATERPSFFTSKKEDPSEWSYTEQVQYIQDYKQTKSFLGTMGLE